MTGKSDVLFVWAFDETMLGLIKGVLTGDRLTFGLIGVLCGFCFLFRSLRVIVG